MTERLSECILRCERIGGRSAVVNHTHNPHYYWWPKLHAFLNETAAPVQVHWSSLERIQRRPTSLHLLRPASSLPHTSLPSQYFKRRTSLLFSALE
jgi:hypothetical protein